MATIGCICQCYEIVNSGSIAKTFAWLTSFTKRKSRKISNKDEMQHNWHTSRNVGGYASKIICTFAIIIQCELNKL